MVLIPFCGCWSPFSALHEEMNLSSLIPGWSQDENVRLQQPPSHHRRLLIQRDTLDGRWSYNYRSEKKPHQLLLLLFVPRYNCHQWANWHKHASSSGKTFNPCTCHTLGLLRGQRTERKPKCAWARGEARSATSAWRPLFRRSPKFEDFISLRRLQTQ